MFAPASSVVILNPEIPRGSGAKDLSAANVRSTEMLRSKLSLCGLVILSEAKNLSAQLLHRVQHVDSNADLEQVRFLLSQEECQ